MSAVTGNLTADWNTLQDMVESKGNTDGTAEAQFAAAVEQEMRNAGQGSQADVAHNISASLYDGTYSQQGSDSAMNAVNKGYTPQDSLQGNIQVVDTELKSGDTSDAANNMHALATQERNAGNTSAADQLDQIASHVVDGSVSSGGAQLALEIVTGTLNSQPSS